MNILIFSWRDIKHPLAGGAEQVMHEHAKGWINAGHKVSHFSSKTKNLKSFETVDGVEFIRSGHQYLGVQLAGFFYYLKNKSKIDLVVDEFHGIPFLTPIFVRGQKLAVVQEVARKVWLLNPLPGPWNWIAGIIGFLGEPFVFLLYKKIPFMVGSNSARVDIIKMGIPPSNITIVSHGVLVPKTSNQFKKEEKKTVIFLGKLSKDKGIEDAIRSFSFINNNGDFQFWIAGKSEIKQYEKKIKKMVNQSNLGGRLKFWGFVSEEKKFELLSKAHILINPSVREGWGLVNIEANSLGIPVVAYQSAGLVDSVNDGSTGLICYKNTPEELADKILSLFNNDKLYMKLSVGARKWSSRFSWERSRNRSLKLLEDISRKH